MAISQFNKDMAIIAALDDEPNDVGGLSAQELKEKFDEGGQALKAYINGTLVPEVNSQFATKEELQQAALGEIPDGSITPEKLAPSFYNAILFGTAQVTYNSPD